VRLCPGTGSGIAEASDRPPGFDDCRSGCAALVKGMRSSQHGTARLIEDYGLLGDMRTAALVSRDGSIDWFCAPRFDSPAAMAAMLGDERNGAWTLRPEQDGSQTRTYLDDTMVLATTWQTATGTARVYDFMPPGSATPTICRVVEGLSGVVEMRSVLRARFDYGRSVPWVRRANHTSTKLTAGPDTLWLTGPVRAEGVGRASVTRFELQAGERKALSLTWALSHRLTRPEIDAERALDDTVRFWRTWISGCSYTGAYRPVVARSLLTLKALTHAETGGIVAAPTTSLPEEIGGERNWDYRYCWLRDASLTLQAFLGCGLVEEAYGWREWLVRAVGGCPSDLQIAYAIDGSRRLPELELSHLAGYQGSRPVRVGNAAVEQFQLDIYGEVAGALSLAAELGLPSPPGLADLHRMLLAHLGRVWRSPDEGIWEVRSGRRHFTHSKVLAWSAFDQAARAVREGRMRGQLTRWEAEAEALRAEVERRSWDQTAGRFTAAFDSPDLDAAVLLLPRTGFVAGDDPRMLATIDAVAADLACEADATLIRRYRTGDGGDGLTGSEGAFLACSFWMVDALAGAGRTGEAEERFDRLVGLGNDLGLLAEEYDPVASRQLGNFPQAFSHLALVGSALALEAVAATGRIPAVVGAGDER